MAHGSKKAVLTAIAANGAVTLIKFATAAQTILSTVPGDKRNLGEVRCHAAARASVQATLRRAASIIDELEAEIRGRLPRVRHITLEVEGISVMALRTRSRIPHSTYSDRERPAPQRRK